MMRWLMSSTEALLTGAVTLQQCQTDPLLPLENHSLFALPAPLLPSLLLSPLNAHLQ
jgi:hypothetical protein